MTENGVFLHKLVELHHFQAHSPTVVNQVRVVFDANKCCQVKPPFLLTMHQTKSCSFTYAPFQLRLSPWCFDAAMTCSDAFGRFLDALRRFLDAFTRLKTLFGRFLDAFGRFLGAFWTLLGRFLDAFWTILGAFWMLFGRFLGAFWTLFGRFLDAFRRFVCNHNYIITYTLTHYSCSLLFSDFSE